MSERYVSWGRFPAATQRVHHLEWRHAGLPPGVRNEATVLPFGNGRSYGDVCLNDGGALLDCAALDRVIAFDAQRGVLRAEAGMRLGDVLDVVVPRGWFLPVSPGTRFATLGGAIANDVHGKNHHTAGTFGRHVRAFELLRSDGETRLCTPDSTPDLFQATVGGLGLTGVMLWAEIQLHRIDSPFLDTETIRFGALREFFALASESDRHYDYTVAWVDCAARGESLGRGLFTRARHAAPEPGDGRVPPRREVSFPFDPPIALVNRWSMQAFNRWYYTRQRANRQRARVRYPGFFYPLDGIRHWNRLYGRRGFLQYQCVVPTSSMEEAMAALLAAVSESGTGSFLAVLKVFGALPSPGWLSFPMPGATLALDFPNHGPATLALLERLDDITRAAGGRVYPAKDARMSAADFRRAYPRWTDLAAVADPRHSSGFWRRVTEVA